MSDNSEDSFRSLAAGQDRVSLKLTVPSCGTAASILERTVLDETAVGTMGIEWTTQRALSRAEEECAVEGFG
jgi:hypothetical protein